MTVGRLHVGRYTEACKPERRLIRAPRALLVCFGRVHVLWLRR